MLLHGTRQAAVSFENAAYQDSIIGLPAPWPGLG